MKFLPERKVKIGSKTLPWLNGNIRKLTKVSTSLEITKDRRWGREEKVKMN